VQSVRDTTPLEARRRGKREGREKEKIGGKGLRKRGKEKGEEGKKG